MPAAPAASFDWYVVVYQVKGTYAVAADDLKTAPVYGASYKGGTVVNYFQTANRANADAAAEQLKASGQTGLQSADPSLTSYSAGSGSIWGDIANAFSVAGAGIGSLVSGAAGVVHGVESTAQALSEVGHWIGVFVTNITDMHMWISLGWLALGLLLFVVGIVWLLRKSGVLPKTAPVPVPVPVPA
jgi:hypothetical protein